MKAGQQVVLRSQSELDNIPFSPFIRRVVCEERALEPQKVYTIECVGQEWAGYYKDTSQEHMFGSCIYLVGEEDYYPADMLRLLNNKRR